LEFWSTVSDEEALRIEDQDPAAPCLNFMKAAAPHLVPILLEMLLKQEEGQEQVC
jgi:importin subunit beta-1